MSHRYRLTSTTGEQPLPASIGPRPDAAYFQDHPIPGQRTFLDDNAAAWLHIPANLCSSKEG